MGLDIAPERNSPGFGGFAGLSIYVEIDRDALLELARRHITQAQLAMATTSVYAWRPEGRPQNSTLSVELAPKSAREIAAVAGVGVRSVEQAKAVQTRATPEVQEAVRRGDVGLQHSQCSAGAGLVSTQRQSRATGHPGLLQRVLQQKRHIGMGL